MVSSAVRSSRPRIARECICCASSRLSRSPAVLMPFVAYRAFGWEPVMITPEWGLRDVPSGTAYPLCNSLQCADCGAVFLDIRFGDDEMAALYSDYRGEAYTAQRERFEPGYRLRDAVIRQGATHTSLVEAFLAPFVSDRPRILDWGGDTGINTPFKSRNELLHVFDISAKAVLPGVVRVNDAALAPGRYDLIVLSHVIEHVPWPEDLIERVVAVMDPDTVLYLETPFEDVVRESPAARDLAVRKKYWHEHVNFFTAGSLRTLVERCALRVEAMDVIEADGGGKHWHIFSMACRRACVS